MNKKLKIALINSYSDRGFAMPIAIGLGLIMLLIAATMIVRSQGDQTTALAQKATARSLGTSETGITRVQSLLNKYGFLGNITLTNIGSPTTSSTWKQVYDTSPAAAAGCAAAVAGATEVDGYRLNQWQDLDSGDQFRVTEYTYTPSSAQITTSATIPVIGSVNLNISPTNYLLDGGSVYGQIQSAQGILSRNGSTYTFKPLSIISVAINVTSTDTFVPKNTSAQLTASAIIPASGSVNFNISPTDYLADGGSVKGHIQGIQGTLSRSGATYTFKRLNSGTATTTTADFYPTSTPGTGSLTLEGRVNQAGTGNTATETAGTATSKLVVNIPVSSGSINTLVPGLWVKNNSITDMGNDKVNGNILINSCPPATSATDSNLYDPNTQDVVAQPIGFPDTPDLPASPYTLTNPWTTLPRDTDVAAADGYYHYLVNNLVASGNEEIVVKPNKKVILYVRGNINLSGNPDLNKDASNTSANLQIYGNTYTDASKTTTKYGCGSLTLGTDCPTLTAHFNGNGTMKTFLHAPDATGSVSGGGNTNGNFIGSIWIKDWDSSSGNSKVKIDASGNYSNYLGAQNMVKPPLISPITSWQRQER
jgi:hypothetical protein